MIKDKLEKHGLFGTRNSVEEAMQYVDTIVETLNPHDRMAAYTAAYVLYNSAIKHMENEDD